MTGPSPLLRELLTAHPETSDFASLADWLPVWEGIQSRFGPSGPFAAAVTAARRADRLAWAFFSAYQGALQLTFDLRPRPSPVYALCANENGRRISEVQTTLKKNSVALELSGNKAWAMAGLPTMTMFVLARNSDGPVKGPGSLLIAKVPLDTPGVLLGTARAQRILPELPHTDVAFNDVELSLEAVLAGDGYRDYVKPFRVREELFIMAAAVAYLVGQAQRLGWPLRWTEKSLALLSTLETCSRGDPSSYATHVVLSGALRIGSDLISEAEVLWADSPASAEHLRKWLRDKPLLQLGEEEREVRTQRAWMHLGSPEDSDVRNHG